MSFSLTRKLPGHYGAPKTSFSLGHTKSYFTLFVQKSSAFYPCFLAFTKRRRNCIMLLLSISEQDSTSRPHVMQSFKVVFTLSAWFIASSHLPHMVKAGKIHFSNRSLKSKSFSFPQEVLQTDTTGLLPEAKATSDSRDLIHK